METFDLVVIGSGAGLRILNAGLERGLKCALVERSRMGGTCLNRGCIPSKILVYPADVIREAEHARKIGLDFELKGYDWKLIGRRMQSKIDQNRHMDHSMDNVPGLKVFRGTGEFTGKDEMKVQLNAPEGKTAEFKGKRFVIATGARSFIPPVEGLEETGYITSESFFGDKFPEKPWKSLIIIGGGVIAAEFSHIFSSFGTEITLIEMLPGILPTEEPEISSFVEKSFRRTMKVFTGHRAVKARVENGRKIVTMKNADTGEEKDVTAEEILVASGLKSNADLLKADKAGIKTGSRGWIETNRFMETNVENIWCLGDANGLFQFRHKANYEAEICVNNIFKKTKKSADYSAVPWAVFTNPQVAHVGMTEAQAVEAGHEIYRAIHNYSEVAKGFAMGYEEGADDDGFVKLVIDRHYRILGAHVVGPHAAMLVQPFVYLMNAGFACNFSENQADALLPREEKACPEGGTFMPIYHSMVIHPSLNEVTGWAIGALSPVNIKQHHKH